MLNSIDNIIRSSKETYTYECIVEFYIQNAPTELIDLSFTLERLR